MYVSTIFLKSKMTTFNLLVDPKVVGITNLKREKQLVEFITWSVTHGIMGRRIPDNFLFF